MPPKVVSVLQKQTREMLYHIFCFLKKEAEEMGTLINMVQLYKRTADLTNTSVSTVRRIVRVGKISGGVFVTPGLSRPRKKPITGLDNASQDSIRTCIHYLQTVKNEELSVEKLRKQLQNDINFQGSENSLRRILKQLGYEWVKVDKNKKRILVEKPEFNDCQQNNCDDDDNDDDDEEEDIKEKMVVAYDDDGDSKANVFIAIRTTAFPSSVTTDEPIAVPEIKQEIKEEPMENLLENEFVVVKTEPL